MDLQQNAVVMVWYWQLGQFGRQDIVELQEEELKLQTEVGC